MSVLQIIMVTRMRGNNRINNQTICKNGLKKVRTFTDILGLTIFFF